MERHRMYDMLQAILSEQTGELVDGVRFRRSSNRDEPDMGLVLDTLIDHSLKGDGHDVRVPVRQLARALNIRPDGYVRALAALSAIRLESSHVMERLLSIEEAEVSEQGEMVVHVRFGGWLTYQIDDVCRPRVPTFG